MIPAKLQNVVRLLPADIDTVLQYTTLFHPKPHRIFSQHGFKNINIEPYLALELALALHARKHTITLKSSHRL
jgi:hypothetical protein